MDNLTKAARKAQRRARFQRWVERNIIADDPRSQEEQRRDESDPDRCGVGYVVFTAVCVVILVGGWWAIYS
jgi:hypothetical protein